MPAKPTAGNHAGEAAARTKNRSSRYSEYPPSTTSVCAVTMLVSAHRNTIAAAISAGGEARLCSGGPRGACFRAAGPARGPPGSPEPRRTAFTPAPRASARQILREADEAGFAGAIGHAGARHVAPGDRGGVANRPARHLERAGRRARAAERAEQVGGEDGRPKFLGQPVEFGRRDRRDGCRGAGVVCEEIEPAHRVDRIADHFFGGARLRHIARRPDHAKTVGAQPLDGGRAAGIVGQVIERDLGAAPGKQLDRRQPDARGRARHQRSLAVKIAHANPLVQKSFARTLPGETPARGSPPAHRRISLKRTPPFALAVGSDSTISTITASAGTEKFFTTASVMSLISARF